MAVFYNKTTKTFIIIYIDNCLIISPKLDYINQLKVKLNKVYAIEDLGPAFLFLGVQIIRDRKNKKIFLS